MHSKFWEALLYLTYNGREFIFRSSSGNFFFSLLTGTITTGFQANKELEGKMFSGKLIIKNKSQNLEMVGLKDSALIHFIDLGITPAPPFRFILLDT